MMTREQKLLRRALLKEAKLLAPIRHTLPITQRLAIEVLLEANDQELPPLISPISSDPDSPLNFGNWPDDKAA